MRKQKKPAVKADRFPALGGEMLGLTPQGPGDPMTKLYGNEEDTQ